MGCVMIKDEDVCLYCGLCVECCFIVVWDMKKYFYEVIKFYCMSGVS